MIRYWCCVILLLPVYLLAQHDVSGRLIDESGDPVIGAVITVGDSHAVSGLSGDFTLKSDLAKNWIIHVSALGYEEYMDSSLTPDTQMPLHILLVPMTFQLDVVKLTSSWIKPNQPFTYAELDASVISESHFGKDVPYTLQSLPSAVVTSDAGTGIGYTGIRIRGSDPTRINVTIDGIPLNDAESQGVYWVDLPDLAGNASAIQVQRGVGTSTHGAGAFGGTINVKTNTPKKRAYAQLDLTAGSFNTKRANLRLGSGLMKNHFVVQASASLINSDGYIDRATSDLYSAYMSAVYFDNRQSVRINFLRGKETTYQAWNGVPAQYIDDPVLRTFNTAGARGDGTFHDDEVDNYGQSHLHLIYQRKLSPRSDFHGALHYTRGLGYFEQYRPNESLVDYGLSGEQVDLIRRRWLDNDFFGAVFNLKMRTRSGNSTTTVGGGANKYIGNHFGNIVWTRNTQLLSLPSEYYRNDAAKMDYNLYLQSEFLPHTPVTLLTDLQLRHVNYDFEGLNTDFSTVDQSVNHTFFNPKLGLNYSLSKMRFYYSIGVAHREPNRNDYVESTTQSRPRSERLVDHELGIRYNEENWNIGLNGFYMRYKDQLVLTGAINDVGEYTRTNVPKSYRTGLEFVGSAQFSKGFRIEGNATWSRNRIISLVESIDDWDTGLQIEQQHKNVPIAFSPEWVAHFQVSKDLWPKSGLKVQISQKYVGRQYLDNTGNAFAALPSYSNTDFRVVYHPPIKGLRGVKLKVEVNNLFDQAYITNGWIYRYRSAGYDARADDPHARKEAGRVYNLTGYYPQAGRQWYVGLSLDF